MVAMRMEFTVVARGSRMPSALRAGFTLIELLVVIAIIALLVSILIPTLSAAKRRGYAVKCLSNLRTLGQGTAIYLNDNNDILMPSRLPKMSGESCQPTADVYGRLKYRPTFVALMSSSVGAPPFDDPQECKDAVDMHGEDGDRQNYSYPVYVCPSRPEWTDERNGAYGYNYQFLGNSRLRSTGQFKNWPVPVTLLRHPGNTVLGGDCMGTAAGVPPGDRLEYDNNSRDYDRYGNEGFNLDPPRIDLADGEVAEDTPVSRSAADPRHANKANIVWVDGHASAESMERLGYVDAPDGSIGYEGDNSRWTGTARDVPWTYDYTPYGD